MGGGQGTKYLVMALSGTRGGKGLVWYIFSYAKGAELRPGGDMVSHLT